MGQRKKIKDTKKVFPKWIWGILTAVVVILAAILLPQIGKNGSNHLTMEISAAQVSKLKQDGIFILDVREQSEWEQFHIPGSTLIPLGELPNRLNEVPNDKLIVVVCRTGHRSAQGRDILLNAGFTQVTSMSGGVTEWKAQGFETVTGQ
jgi:rhodanese-related sulfurtransferase